MMPRRQTLTVSVTADSDRGERRGFLAWLHNGYALRGTLAEDGTFTHVAEDTGDNDAYTLTVTRSEG